MTTYLPRYTRTLLSDIATPVSLFARLSQLSDFAFLLESNDGDSRLARYSFIGINPAKTIQVDSHHVTIYDRHLDREQVIPDEVPMVVLSELMAEYQKTHAPPDELLSLVPFTGGLFGYMGFGMTERFENIPRQQNDVLGVPDGLFGLYDTLVVFDHLYHRLTLISPDKETLALLEKTIHEPDPLKPLAFGASDTKLGTDEAIFKGVSESLGQENYMAVVDRAKEAIRIGEIFQIVPAQRYSLPISATPVNVYRYLKAVNPSPYGYILQFPDMTYVGSSPETYVSVKNSEVTLRALAGTRPRGADDEEDNRLMAELRSNEKELAEHRMLVDLGRNDLGRVCVPGSVSVGEIATVTKYTHVMHLATEVSGMLKSDHTPFDMARSCFPRGTVSGAPKIRAMEMLSKLEPEQRGVYSGMVGYFDDQGNMDSAIAIRSVLIKDQMAHVHAGAGVVYDSDPLMEYEETRNKAKSVLRALQLAENAVEVMS